MSDYFDRIERRLVSEVQAGGPRRSRLSLPRDHLAVAASLLIVVVVSAGFIGIRGSGSTGSPANTRALTIVLSASPLDPNTALGPALTRSATVLRHRFNAVFRGVRVSRVTNGLVVVVPKAPGVSRERILALTVPARLEFYDWEANVLTRNGNTVASELRRQDRLALKLSQGSGLTSPGEPGAGSLPLYEAVTLAARQPSRTTLKRAHSGPQYYLFGAPNSPACQAAAKERGTLAFVGVHCLLAGPENDLSALSARLPAGVNAAEVRRLKVPRGIVVLQAADVTAAHPTPASSPAAQFYVLTDNAFLTGQNITRPEPSTDSGGAPDVRFGFDSVGATEFRNMTAVVAHRGALDSPSFPQTQFQHFAVALDNKLITVPSIDFRTYPDGVGGEGGADITDGFTSQSAQTLATLLRYGPLPVTLVAR